MIRSQLVDRLRLMIFPVVLGMVEFNSRKSEDSPLIWRE